MPLHTGLTGKFYYDNQQVAVININRLGFCESGDFSENDQWSVLFRLPYEEIVPI